MQDSLLSEDLPTSDELGTHNIHFAVKAVQKDISNMGISKGQRNAHGNYNFRGIDDIYNTFSTLLAKHELTVIPRVMDIIREVHPNEKGKLQFTSVVTVQYTMYAPDGSSIDGTAVGEGRDSQDKATSKAMSAAYKYFMFQTFCIPTEEFPDADATNPGEVVQGLPAISDDRFKGALTKLAEGDKKIPKMLRDRFTLTAKQEKDLALCEERMNS